MMPPVNGLTVGKGLASVATNTVLGVTALDANTSGSDNVSVGYDSLTDNTSGANNVALGSSALANNTTASNNTAVGYQAGYSNTTGATQVYIGYQAGYSNQTGINNMYIGSQAGYWQTGGLNLAIGFGSFIGASGSSTGTGNTALGNNTLNYNTSGSFNTAIGYTALNANTTASNNTAVGWQALYDNTTGGGNVALGYTALANNTTGGSNVALGYGTLIANTTASNNTAVGTSSMTTITTGIANTAVGSQTMLAGTTAARNTAMGYAALRDNTNNDNTAIGYFALEANTSGANNVAVGTNALTANTTGTNNTALGYSAGSTLTTGTNNTLLGYDAEPSSATVSNEVTIGNDSVTVTRLKGNVGIGTTDPITGGITGTNPRLTLAGEGGTANTNQTIANYYTGANGPAFSFVKGRGTIASPTATSSSDNLGTIGFTGYNSGNTIANAVRIGAIQDGAAGATYIPGAITFSTATSSAVAAERMRIDASGNVGIGTSTISTGRVAIFGNGNGIASSAVNANSQLHIVTSDATVSADNAARITFNAGNGSIAGSKIEAVRDGLNSFKMFANQINGSIQLGTNNTERMRIAYGGDVGIGTSSPSGYAGAKLLNIYGTSSPGQLILEGGTGTNFLTAYSGISAGDLPAIYYNQGLRLGTATSKDATGFVEAMRINSNSNLLMGTTTEAANEAPLVLSKNSGTTRWAVGPFNSVPTNFYITANSAAQGVYLNGAAATSWSGLSDERYKTDLKNIENAIDKISTLRAVTGRFTEDEEQKSRSFLIAQDVQKVLPEAVDDSNPDRLGLAYTDTIPLLVAAIKEQQDIIKALETRIEALENK
jgi:hypothetical protein